MRVLNTHTLQFEQIADSQLGTAGNKYAILSHRWGRDEDEVSFTDVKWSRDYSHKPAFAKLVSFCIKAASWGYRHVWIDTCCIDKSSSTELNEAITSMYSWYQRSDFCVVYLADVPNKAMYESDWWTRGWTLQELIGPKNLSFYDSAWNLLGTKIELKSDIASMTGIPEDVLSHDNNPDAYSVAQRMSWAARRETKRLEDRAYSLLGIFGVYMLPNYGEGDHAFQRLQETIIDDSKDESIFAWGMGLGEDQRTYTGLLAPSPSSYVDCGNVVKLPGSRGFHKKNGEIRIELSLIPYTMGCYWAALNCTFKDCPKRRISILIAELPTADQYVRKKPTKHPKGISLVNVSAFRVQARKVRFSMGPAQTPPRPISGFWLRTVKPPGHTDCNITVASRGPEDDAVIEHIDVREDNDEPIWLSEDHWGTVGIISLERTAMLEGKNVQPGECQIRWIRFGFDQDRNPMLSVEHELCQAPFCVGKWDERAEALHDKDGVDTLFDNWWILSERKFPFPERTIIRATWPAGISILKADDKKKGLAMVCRGLDLYVSVRRIPGQKFWVVDIMDIRSEDYMKMEDLKFDRYLRRAMMEDKGKRKSPVGVTSGRSKISINSLAGYTG